MTKALAIVSMYLILCLFLTARAIPDTGIDGDTYRNEEWDFRISLPNSFDNWYITDERPGEALVYIMGPWDDEVEFEPRVGVYTDILARPETLDEYLQKNLTGLRILILNWNETSRRGIRISGEDAYEIIYTGRASGRDWTWMQHYVVKELRGYVITAAHVPDKFKPVPFREIMSTFRFLSSPIEVLPKRRLATTWSSIKSQ